MNKILRVLHLTVHDPNGELVLDVRHNVELTPDPEYKNVLLGWHGHKLKAELEIPTESTGE